MVVAITYAVAAELQKILDIDSFERKLRLKYNADFLDLIFNALYNSTYAPHGAGQEDPHKLQPHQKDKDGDPKLRNINQLFTEHTVCAQLGLSHRRLKTLTAVKKNIEGGGRPICIYKPDKNNFHSVSILDVVCSLVGPNKDEKRVMLVREGALPQHVDPLIVEPHMEQEAQDTFKRPISSETGMEILAIDWGSNTLLLSEDEILQILIAEAAPNLLRPTFCDL